MEGFFLEIFFFLNVLFIINLPFGVCTNPSFILVFVFVMSST